MKTSDPAGFTATEQALFNANDRNGEGTAVLVRPGRGSGGGVVCHRPVEDGSGYPVFEHPLPGARDEHPGPVWAHRDGVVPAGVCAGLGPQFGAGGGVVGSGGTDGAGGRARGTGDEDLRTVRADRDRSGPERDGVRPDRRPGGRLVHRYGAAAGDEDRRTVGRHLSELRPMVDPSTISWT